MHTNYNIPQKTYYKPETFKNNQNYMNNYTTNYIPSNYGINTYSNDDRFFGGGILAPFLLGGVGGYLLGRPNYNNFGPGPIPVYFPPQSTYPIPYSNTNIYY